MFPLVCVSALWELLGSRIFVFPYSIYGFQMLIDSWIYQLIFGRIELHNHTDTDWETRKPMLEIPLLNRTDNRGMTIRLDAGIETRGRGLYPLLQLRQASPSNRCLWGVSQCTPIVLRRNLLNAPTEPKRHYLPAYSSYIAYGLHHTHFLSNLWIQIFTNFLHLEYNSVIC